MSRSANTSQLHPTLAPELPVWPAPSAEIADLPSEPAARLALLRTHSVRLEANDCFSVLDVISWRKQTRYPSAELQRLLRRHPELEEKLGYTQFPGRRQNQTPTLPLRELGYLCRLLASKNRPVRPPQTKPTPPLVAIVASQKAPIVPHPDDRPAPYGWRWDSEGKLLCPVHAELQTVRYVRQLRAFGTKLSEIALQLERDGIRPRGGAWSAELLEEMLLTPHDALLRQHDEFWRRWRSGRRRRE
jgi:hypothetical protein